MLMNVGKVMITATCFLNHLLPKITFTPHTIPGDVSRSIAYLNDVSRKSDLLLSSVDFNDALDDIGSL